MPRLNGVYVDQPEVSGEAQLAVRMHSESIFEEYVKTDPLL